MNEVCKELSNEIQLELLKLLKTKKNINQLQKELKEKLKKQIYRETIYNKLEKLVELGIAQKEYDSTSKRLVYYTLVKGIMLDLENLQIAKIIRENKK